MATVITTQPTNSPITRPAKIAQNSNFNSINAGDESSIINGDLKEDTRLLTDGVVSEDMVHLNSVEDDEDEEKRKFEEEEERRRQQKPVRNNNARLQNCCCMYSVSDDYNSCCLLDCIMSCFQSMAIDTNNSYNCCGNCTISCCERKDATVDSENIPSSCDCYCSGCDCSGCDCSGCDCSGCDCSGCDCGDCNSEDCAD